MSEIEKALHSKNHAFIYVTPSKWRTLDFRCALKKHDFELEVLQCVTLGIQSIPIL